MSLHNQERIDAYLRGELSSSERKVFEADLKKSNELKKQYNQSRLLKSALERKALKKDIRKAKLSTNLPWWGLGVSLVLAAIALSIYLFNKQEEQLPQYEKKVVELNRKPSIEEKNIAKEYSEKLHSSSEGKLEEGEKSSGKTTLDKRVYRFLGQSDSVGFKPLKEQVFWVKPTKEFELEGKEGTVIKFPKYAFETNDSIKVILEEYYDLMDMILANLTTQTIEADLLQTGGMIKLKAFDKSGNELKLSEGKQLEIKMAEKLNATNDMTIYYGHNSDDGVSWERGEEEISGASREMFNSTHRRSIYYKKADKIAKFKGGEEGLKRAINEQILYRHDMKQEKPTMVKVHYSVDKFGYVNWVSVISESPAWADELVKRALLSLPRFETIGEHEGNKAAISFTRELEVSPQTADKYYNFEEWENYYDSIEAVREAERKAAGVEERRDFFKQLSHDVKENNESPYSFKSDRLGWINLDGPCYRDTRVIAVTIPDHLNDAKVRLVHPTRNIIIAPIGNEFKKLPTGVALSVFAYREINGRKEYSLKKWEVSEKFPSLSFKENIPSLKD